jgi:hypothetical protein
MANAAITPRSSETAFKPAILPDVKLIGMYFSYGGGFQHPVRAGRTQHESAKSAEFGPDPTSRKNYIGPGLEVSIDDN